MRVRVSEAYMGYMWDACTGAHRRVPKGNVPAGPTGTLVPLRGGVYVTAQDLNRNDRLLI